MTMDRKAAGELAQCIAEQCKDRRSLFFRRRWPDDERGFVALYSIINDKRIVEVRVGIPYWKVFARPGGGVGGVRYERDLRWKIIFDGGILSFGDSIKSLVDELAPKEKP